MTSTLRLFRQAFLPVCGIVLALASGCATATKPAPHPVAVTSPVATTPILANTDAPVPIAPMPPTPPPTVMTGSLAKPVEPLVPIAPAAVASHASIKGSEQTSLLLDNFTVFIASIDGRINPAGRNSWDAPMMLDAGRRRIEVEFNRGVFVARTALEIDAKANARYAVKFDTDAELFGNNTYCDFWIIDLATGTPVSTVVKAAIKKISAPPER